MEHKFDIKRVLSVFQKILDHGQKVDNEYRLHGVSASTDFDGYTCIMHDEAVTLYIYFHNSRQFEYKRKIELEQFMERLEEIERLDFADRSR